MESHRLFLGSKVSREGWAWLMVLASLPLVAWCLTRLSSGFDYWPAMALARGVRYGATVLFAYPLPLYLPFAPLGLLPDPWPQLLAPVISIAFLAAGLWLWGARRIVVLAALLLSPVGLGVLVNSNFNSGVAVFGLGLAVWAKRTGHHPLVGLGIALSLWRPANCLPAIAVLMLSGWRWRGLIEAAVAGLLFLAPITAVAFLYQPDWLGTYSQLLPVYRGWAGLGPHLLNVAGPFAYAAAQAAAAVAGVWLLRRRTLAEATAFSFALTVLLATLAGAYSGAEALPALTLAANESRYRSLPAIASLIGWMQTAVLLAINYPVGLVAYWFVLQTYPLLKKPGPAPPDSDAPMHVSRAQAELGSSSMERLSISR